MTFCLALSAGYGGPLQELAQFSICSSRSPWERQTGPIDASLMPAGDMVSILPASGVPATGTRRLLFIRAAFLDDLEIPISDTDARQLLSDAAAWYDEHSYHSLTIVGEVTPLVFLPQTRIWYSQQPPAALMDDARVQAKAAGFDTLLYDLDAVRHSDVPGWGFLGLAATGTKGIWLQSSSVGVLVHELGHSFGLEHADAWAGQDDSIIGPGAVINYGNPFDTMGLPQSDLNRFHFSVIWKSHMNWIPANSIQQVTHSGVVRLFAFDVPRLSRENCYGIKIRKDDWRDYWVEFRQSLPEDNWSRRGILINLSGTPSGGSGAFLLDATPGTSSAKDGYADAFLTVGSTLSDTLEGIHITPLAVGTTGTERWIDVQINLGSFPGNTPPLLVVTADRTIAAANEEVVFRATAGDADGDPLAFHWDFGDLTEADTVTAGKSWPTAGQYVARCTVSDMKGGTATRSVLVTVGSPNTFAARGKVVDPDGNGISGVRVHNGLSGEQYRGTRTDGDGTYVLPNLALGLHQLLATRYGYRLAPVGWTGLLVVTGDAAGIDWGGTKLPSVEVYALDDLAVETDPAVVDGRFLIQRSGPLDSSLSVQLRFSGSATYFGDYTTEFFLPPTFAITLPVGVSSTNIGIKPQFDSIVEDPETIELMLIERTNYVTGFPHRATVGLFDRLPGDNTAPIAGTDTLTRNHPGGASIDLSTLLSNDTDPDGDPVTIGSVATLSTLGATIAKTGNVIRYIPLAAVTGNDSFTYTLVDGRGLSASGVVDVIAAPLPRPVLTFSITNGVRVLAGNGAPGLGYRLEVSESLSTGSWQTAAGITNGSTGRFLYFEPSVMAGPSRFYRLAFP